MSKRTILIISAFAVLALLAGSASTTDVGAERADHLDLSNSVVGPEDCTGEPCWQQ
jgi:hypothetical protein